MHGHMQQAGKICERATHPKCKRDDPHVLDGGVGKHPFDVAPPVEHEGRKDDGEQPHGYHQRPRRERSRIGREQHLETEQSVERDVQQKTRKHRGYRRGPFGMGIGQPCMQRRKPHLRAVAEKKKHKGEIEQRGIEVGGAQMQTRPHHGFRDLPRSPAAPPYRPGWSRTARARCRRCQG